MAKRVLGYNLVFKANDKLFGGTTANNFDITPKIKDSITKEDGGQTKKTVVGYDTEITVDGIVEINDSGDEATRIDRFEMINLVTTGGKIPFVYGGTTSGDKVHKGEMLITKYSEKTDSENEATYSISCSVVTKLTEDTVI